MSEYANCFDMQAPCLSEDGVNCASFYHANAITHAVATVTYICDKPAVEIVVEFNLAPDEFFTTKDEFAGFSVMADPITIGPGESVLISADIAGSLAPSTHINLTSQVWVDGEPIEGGVNSNNNLEIVE